MQMGIVGRPAPALRAVRWIGGDGEDIDPVSLESLGAGFRILYFFQNWCDGCHAHGFPALAKLVQSLSDKGIGFAAIQTVFEGFDANTFEDLRPNQERYGLKIPFGHAGPEAGASVPVIMEAYRTGGTPWFVVIAPEGRVVSNGFQLYPDLLIRSLRPDGV